MAYDYALVHLQFTIPVAAVLTAICYPVLTRRHWYQTGVLIAIAVAATTPWDSYLIRRGIWTYPPGAILGPTLLSIPAEELFFFVVQAYVTSLLYHLVNKPLLHAAYLLPPPSSSRLHAALPRLIQFAILHLALTGVWLVARGGEGTYMGLILAWASPFALLTWTLGGRFVAALPWPATAVPVLLPTLYLWAVDERALRRGTWAIASGTKLDCAPLGGSLDAEEAVFFFATNALVVLGLAAFDAALAVVDALPADFPTAPECPPPAMLLRALLLARAWTPEREERLRGLREAAGRLRTKSRSFHLAASTFTGRLRIDLVLLYSYCRTADDLIDEPPEGLDARTWIARLSHHLDLVYKRPKGGSSSVSLQANDDTTALRAYIDDSFPPAARSALALLPAPLLPPEPLYLLLEGFRTDTAFAAAADDDGRATFPISDETDLRRYASRVAGTVGQLCLALIMHHHHHDAEDMEPVIAAARHMGVALQYVNVARDIAVDAALGRVYLPTAWLAEVGLAPEDVVAKKQQVEKLLVGLVTLRRRLLGLAFGIYAEARPAMDLLPRASRRPMVVAVESYMEIGRVLLEEREGGASLEGVGGQGRGGRRATVPRLRRLRVALRALLNA